MRISQKVARAIRGPADLLTYPLAVACARWVAIGWIFTQPRSPSAAPGLGVALLAYGLITTLFAMNFWHGLKRGGRRCEEHPLFAPALIAIDLSYAVLTVKLYGITMLVLVPALDAAMLAMPLGLVVLAAIDLVFFDVALAFHGNPSGALALQIVGLTFGPYFPALFGLHGRQRAQAQVRAIDEVLNAGSELGSQMSLASVLRQLLNLLGQFRRVVPWDTCIIYVVQYDEETEEEKLVAAEIAGINDRAYRGKVAFGAGVAGYAAAKQRPLLIADLQKDAREPYADTRPGARGSLVVPVVADEQAVGCVQLVSSEPNTYTTDQLEHVGRLISLASVGVRNALIHSRTRLMADTDSLTGLLSHRAYHERLESEFRKAQAARKSLSLLIIDVDNFKQVNDRYGHQAGDEFLRRVGTLLRQQARRNDVCCRYGGDEFIVVMPETIKSEAAVVAERVRKAVQEISFDSGSAQVQATVSIGVAGYPQDVTTKQALIKAADDALYAAKEEGRNSLRVFAQAVAR